MQIYDNNKAGKNKLSKNEEKEQEDFEFPKFNFDGKNALQSKLWINLKHCQYKLFREVAINDFGWQVLDHRNKLLPAKQ